MKLLTSKFSKLSLISLMGLTISACGGGGTGDDYNNSAANTSIKFPMHTYKLIGERNWVLEEVYEKITWVDIFNELNYDNISKCLIFIKK